MFKGVNVQDLKRYIVKHLKMSVIKAILFYSKYNKKSVRMKQVAKNINTDIESICVDSTEIRDQLLDDERFCITEVPSVLILYSSGQHKIYTSSNLDKWFEQLLQNINQYQEEQQPMMQQQPPQTQLPIQPIDENIPKPLRRKPGGGVSIPTSLPSPGRPLLDQGLISGGSGIIGTGAQAAIAQQHIRQPEPLVSIESQPVQPVQPAPREVKGDGPTPKELARQMEEQREQFDERTEQNRPFL